MKQRLRADIFRAYAEMAHRGLPVDPHLFETVRGRLADASLCGRWATMDARPFPPPPSAMPPTAPNKLLAPAPLSKAQEKAAKKKAAKKAAGKMFEVGSIVKEAPGTRGVRRWFVVRWAGYDPTWEDWRKPLFPGHNPGRLGEPVETWAELADVAGTEALAAWDAAQA
jgi:hypothetical protein